MVAPVVAAGLWMAIGVAGRRAAKKYGFLIARKKFPKLFKKVPKKDKTPDTKKTTPEKKPSTEKKKPTQTLSNEQVAKYLDLQRRRPNAFKKVPDWIKDTVRKRSAQVREQQSIAYQRGQKPSSVPKKGRKVQGGNKKTPDSAADKKEQLSPPRSKPKSTTAKEREGKVKKIIKKRLPKIRKDTPELRKKMAEREKKRADIVEQMHDLSREHDAITGGQYLAEEEKIHDEEMGQLRSKLKKLK